MKSKIIQITSYFPPHLGGMEQRIRDLSERLAKKGHQVEVFTSNIGCPKDKQLKSTKNLKIHYLSAWEFAHTTIIPSLFWRLMKIPKDSIMHVHIAQALVPEIVWLVSKLRGIPYVTHIRGNVSPSGKLGFLLDYYKKYFLKRVLINSNKVIVLTKDYINFIQKKYNLKKINLINIPNASKFEPVSKINIKNLNIINLLFVGRLSEQKQLPLLINSIDKLIKKSNRRINLNLVGEGDQINLLKDMVSMKKLEKNIFFKGRLSGDRLYNEYLNSDIVLLITKDEGFSSVLLESMATGTPIIASDIMGTRSIIKNDYNGLLVKPTPEKIVEAIERLIKNPKLRGRLAKNGLKEVKKYSWDKIVKQTEQIYKEVLEEHNKK